MVNDCPPQTEVGAVAVMDGNEETVMVFTAEEVQPTALIPVTVYMVVEVAVVTTVAAVDVIAGTHE
jgi:hypothetical protein